MIQIEENTLDFKQNATDIEGGGQINYSHNTDTFSINKPIYLSDNSNKTLEQRLTELGFKEATITNVNSTYIKNIDAFTQGKVVAVKIEIKGFLEAKLSSPKTLTVAKISNIDLSKIPENGILFAYKTGNRSPTSGIVYYYVNYYYLTNNGTIELRASEGFNEGKKETGGFIYIENPQKNIYTEF